MSDTIVEDYPSKKPQTAKFCLRCEIQFPFKKNKIFCSSNCRKRHSEVTQNSFISPEKKRRNMEFFERASRIAEQHFRLMPQDRDSHISDLIEMARSGEDKSLRDILSNKVLLDATNSWGNHLRGNRGRSYGSIAQAAEAYCWKFWKASVKDVVYGRTLELSKIE